MIAHRRMLNTAELLSRAEKLIELAVSLPTGDDPEMHFAELLTGALTLTQLIYGPQSDQVAQMKNFTSIEAEYGRNLSVLAKVKAAQVEGVLRSLKADVDAGVVGDLEIQIAADVLADFIILARTALKEQGEGRKNVSAVLAAAAYEDTIRRMGTKYLAIVSREDLSEILQRLKTARVIHGSQVGIAQSYLNFRNNALHADWAKIGRPEVTSLLGFIEELLLKHFS